MNKEQEARDARTLDLNDCGRVVKVYNPDFRYSKITYEVEVQMVIKAPKGTLVIYKSPYYQDIQGEAIKAFIDTHKNG